MAKEKDAYWFRHDSNSGRGLRLRKLQHKHGHWGKGVYWDVVEVLREQSGYKYESDEASLQLLCELIVVKDFDHFKEFFEDCLTIKLFVRKNGKFYSETLIKNMKKWESSKSNGSKGGRPKGIKNKNPINNPTESQSKANGNHNSIGEEIRGENILSPDSKKPDLREIFFNDLPNSTKLETISSDLNIPKDVLIGKIPAFRKAARPEYKDFNDFCFHFKKWADKVPEVKTPKKNQPA